MLFPLLPDRDTLVFLITGIVGVGCSAAARLDIDIGGGGGGGGGRDGS